MVTPESVKVPSPAELRRRRASKNRARIVTAAADLFATEGYSGTTMDAVAVAADMSVQSVYFNFGNKANLLQAAFDLAALTPTGTPPALTDWYRAALAQPDADLALGALIAGTGEILKRTGPLALAAAAAAPGDLAAAEVHERNERLRLMACNDLARAVTAKRPLRDGVTKKQASDIIYGLLSPQLHSLMTGSRSWTYDHFVAWVTQTIREALWGY